MSMENAILELAASLRYLADTARGANFGEGRQVGMPATLGAPYGAEGNANEPTTDSVQEKAGKRAQASSEADAAAPHGSKTSKGVKEVTGAVTPDAELEQDVSKVEADATAEANGDPDVVLDYVKDIRPTLLAAIKKAGKEQVQAMIQTFGVEKADKVDPAKYGELLAGAQKLAA